MEYLGLENANVTAGTDSAILVGEHYGVVHGVYITGRMQAVQRGGGIAGHARPGSAVRVAYSTAEVGASSGRAGGIAGQSNGSFTAVYNVGRIHSSNNVGGIVGRHAGSITASYSTGRIDGGAGGGLVGNGIGEGGTATDSYWDTQTSGRSTSDNGTGLLSRQLKRPTAYATIYENWNVDLDGDPDTNDDPWDFGGPRDYPLLKVDFNGDGEATWEEFGNQYRAPPPGPPAYNPASDHPEIYASPRHGITATCAVRTTGTGDDAVTTSTLTFDLAEYTRPITLALSLWDRTHFRSLQSLGITMPTLQRDGQMATVEVVTDPARTRFRLDGAIRPESGVGLCGLPYR